MQGEGRHSIAEATCRNRHRERDVSGTWIRVQAERVLYVHRGRDVILCTEHSFPSGAEYVLRLSDEAKEALRRELATTPFIQT